MDEAMSWTFSHGKSSKDTEGPKLELHYGKWCAATVYLNYDVVGFHWYVWNKDGVGGENSMEHKVEQAIEEAEKAVNRMLSKDNDASRCQAMTKPQWFRETPQQCSFRKLHGTDFCKRHQIKI